MTKIGAHATFDNFNGRALTSLLIKQLPLNVGQFQRSLSISAINTQDRSTGHLPMEVMHHSTAFLLPPTLSPASEIQRRIPPTFYALVVLNQPLPSFAPLLWQHAQLKVFADGGANRVFDEMPLLFPHEEVLSVRQRYKPDAIKGDMDSIRPEVLDFYAGLGSKTIDESHDQDTTDLNKCVSYIRDCAEELKLSDLCIIVTGALGGRFDHEAGNLNVLYRFSTLRIVLISGDSIIHLLPRTHHHEIHIEPTVVGPHCGLVPVGVSCSRSTTTGLEWNLSDTEMKFGGLVSTSNLVKDNTVTVQSDSDLLWTVSIRKTEIEANVH
ncbi:hypothetical protein V2J09_016104 [Rumex salicifolius]